MLALLFSTWLAGIPARVRRSLKPDRTYTNQHRVRCSPMAERSLEKGWGQFVPPGHLCALQVGRQILADKGEVVHGNSHTLSRISSVIDACLKPKALSGALELQAGHHPSSWRDEIFRVTGNIAKGGFSTVFIPAGTIERNEETESEGRRDGHKLKFCILFCHIFFSMS